MRFAVALLSLTAICAPAVAAAETFEDALASAVASNPDMEDARLGVESARMDRVQARASYFPSVDLNASYGAQDFETRRPGLPDTDERFDPSSASVRLTQQLFTSGRRGGQMRTAQAGVEGAQYVLRGTEQDVLLSAAEAYLTVLSSEQIARIRQEQVVSLDREVAATQRRLQVGDVSRTDLLQVQTRLAGARADLARANADVEIARARYVDVIGAPPSGLAPAPPAPQVPASLDDAIARAEAAHPQVLQGRAQVEAARGRVAVERSALLPQVSVVGSFDHFEDDNFINREREGTSAEARFSMPLFEGGYAWARTHQSRVNVDRARARLDAARRDTISRVTAVWSQAQAAHAVRDEALQQADVSQQALAGAERERGLGMRSTIDVLNAQQEWRDAQVSLARAEAQNILASYALLAATGELSVEALQTSPR